MLEIALYQPDIAANAGAIARLAACFGLRLTIIEPAGFTWDDSRLRRAGMDYLDIAVMRRCPSWDTFLAERNGRRIVLLTTQGSLSHASFPFKVDDIILLGRESAGVPQIVHDTADARLCIPLAQGARSLNMAMAAGIVTAEALRQTGGFPPLPITG